MSSASAPRVLSSAGTNAASGKLVAYRPDIDGLRAFSILSVLFYHGYSKVLPGGFIGVDVFFVISGYLISGIIFKSLAAGEFSYANFYNRRIKRIFPSLSVVLVAVLVAGWLFLFPDEFKQLGKHIFGGAAFISNIFLMHDGGYFVSSSQPLLHLWSLGIEEQFYIAWPLLLALCWKKRWTVPASMAVILVVSFALNVALIAKHPTQVFYFPATRFWELSIGGLFAYASAFHSEDRWFKAIFNRPALVSTLSAIGLVLLIASTLILNDTRLFPGVWALMPTLGALFMISAGPKAWLNRVVLSSPLMVFFGLISYPLYLWHWPVLYFLRTLFPQNTSWALPALGITVSVLLSQATFKLVEGKLRHRPGAGVVWALAASVAVVGFAGGLGALLPHTRLDNANTQPYVAALTDWNYPFHYNYKKTSGFRSGELPGNAREHVLFIGDSHMEQYFSRVKSLSDAHPTDFATPVFLTAGGCPPLPAVNRTVDGFACDKFFDYAMQQADDPKVTAVVFCAYWEAYFGFEAHLDSENHSRLVYRENGDTRTPASSLQVANLVLHDFGSTIRSLTSRGKRVFVILSNADSDVFDPKYMVSRFSAAPKPGIAEDVKVQREEPIRKALTKIATDAGATIIDPLPYFCTDSGCPTMRNGAPLYRDGDHLRASYVARTATFIDQVLQP